MAIKPGGGRTTGGSKPSGKMSPGARKKLIHNGERTLLHNAMKQNGENKLSRQGAAESASQVFNNSRYDRWTIDGKPMKGNTARENNVINDAADIRKKRRAATQKGGASAKSSGGGGSRSDAVRKAWVTRRKNKGG